MPDPHLPAAEQGHDKFRRLVERAQREDPAATAIAHPCDEAALESAVEASRLRLIEPILVGPKDKILAVADKHGFDIGAFEIVDAEHSDAAAA
ncbi:MAG TPA: enoyl-CoA hydratase, partial [Allosphingosinicella sp.]|nr:enoyl-CoA hydratase [Allosphingosinicella sp.]